MNERTPSSSLSQHSNPNSQPGDFKFDPLGFAKDEQSLKKLQLNELKNGRLAMLAFSGIVTQAALTGHSFPYM